MQESEYKTPIPNTNNVKQCDIGPGHSYYRVVNKAVDQWRIWLCAYKKAKGHHFEHLL